MLKGKLLPMIREKMQLTNNLLTAFDVNLFLCASVLASF
jgi:hypothetical protein